MNTIIRRVLAFILSFALIFATTVRANANTSIGGWSALDTVTAGATNTINAAKTAGGKALKSAVTVAPSAAKVGKHLIRGGGAAALAFAMVELADGAIDWVLDPANNSVRYTKPGSDASDLPPLGKGWIIAGNPSYGFFASSIAAATSLCQNFGDRPIFDKYVSGASGTGGEVYCKKAGAKGAYSGAVVLSDKPDDRPLIGAPSPTEVSIPIADVAAKVIANAEAGHAPSQEAVKATALEGFAAGEHDAALDAAATETGTENPPDTENPPKDPDAPAEPFDPAGIISAINALKALLAGILSSITSLSDFFQSEPPPEPKPEDTALDIPVPDLPMPDTDINFGGSCPANFEFNGSIFGNPINIVLLDTSKFCGFLSTFVKFPVYAASSLFALYILGGRKDV